ncbi:hypothetical protein Ddc_05063 [Ditylenchus destructor]|nr:hypothetical protein Ddc_05063 [Ditylenchus destructor]
MWYYELFRFFSRKELAKLQFGNKFFTNAIRELKLPPLHFIDRLIIINFPNMEIVYFIGKEKISVDKLIPGEDFCPPSYVRFFHQSPYLKPYQRFGALKNKNIAPTVCLISLLGNS